jgi:hypothetical protein
MCADVCGGWGVCEGVLVKLGVKLGVFHLPSPHLPSLSLSLPPSLPPSLRPCVSVWCVCILHGNEISDKMKLKTVMRQSLREDHPAKRTHKKNAKKKVKYIQDVFHFLTSFNFYRCIHFSVWQARIFSGLPRISYISLSVSLPA